MINSKLFLGELELITMTDDFYTCVNKTRRKSSCIYAHSTVKLTHGVVHFIHRVYMLRKKNRKLKRVDKSKSMRVQNHCCVWMSAK